MGLSADDDKDEDRTGAAAQAPPGEKVVLDDEDGKGDDKSAKPADGKVADGGDPEIGIVQDERLQNNAQSEEDGDLDADGRPRETTAQRRARQRAARERTERELNFLRKRNEDLERRYSADMFSIDQRLMSTEYERLGAAKSDIADKVRQADQVIAEAVKQGAGEDVVEATNIKNQLLARQNEIDQRQRALLQRAQQQRQQPAQPPQPAPDPEISRRAEAWVSRNGWFNEPGPDSQLARVIDGHLAQEGYDPRNEDYWQKLDERLAERLPHRYPQRSPQREQSSAREAPRDESRRDPDRPTMPSANRQPALKPNEVWVSPERRKALEDLGVWDDPKLRNRYLKRYAEYDRQAQAVR